MSSSDWGGKLLGTDDDGKPKITREEYEMLTEVLKKDEFRKLFFEYCEELNDPEQRKIYETELTQFENERGVDITFINPEPGFVLKTSIDGDKKCFINIAHSDKVDKPSYEMSASKNGANWKIPLTQSPPRHDYDKNRKSCLVYDVVFHTDTLRMCETNKNFRKIVIDSALDAVQKSFNVQIDRNNVKYPKMKFKGLNRPTVIRKKIDDFEGERETMFDDHIPPIPDNNSTEVHELNVDSSSDPQYTIPKYKIVQRRNVDMQECVEDQNARLHVTIPKEIVIVVDLPLLRTTKDVELDVLEKEVKLLSDFPTKYKLNIHLPYPVDESQGTAKFDKNTKKLTITLPVKRDKFRTNYFRNKTIDFKTNEMLEGRALIQEITVPIITPIPEIINNEHGGPIDENPAEFLDPNIAYQIPQFTIEKLSQFQHAIVINMGNLDPSSLHLNNPRQCPSNFIQLKFFVIGPGYYPIHYSLYIQFLNDIMVNVGDTNFTANKLAIEFAVDDDSNDVDLKYIVGQNEYDLDDVD